MNGKNAQMTAILLLVRGVKSNFPFVLKIGMGGGLLNTYKI